MKLGEDATIVPVSPGTEIAAMLAGQADIAIATSLALAGCRPGRQDRLRLLELRRTVLQYGHHGSADDHPERP